MQQTGHPPQDAGINKATNVTLRVELINRMLPFLVLEAADGDSVFRPISLSLPPQPLLVGCYILIVLPVPTTRPIMMMMPLFQPLLFPTTTITAPPDPLAVVRGGTLHWLLMSIKIIMCSCCRRAKLLLKFGISYGVFHMPAYSDH